MAFWLVECFRRYQESSRLLDLEIPFNVEEDLFNRTVIKIEEKNFIKW